MMSGTQLASAQSRTLAVKSLGYDLAAMDVNSKGQLICYFWLHMLRHVIQANGTTHESWALCTALRHFCSVK